DVPGVRCVEPEGAFYVFPDVRDLMRVRGIQTSKELELRLLEECQIALTAGGSFGTEGYVRISYACSMEELEKGLDRMESYIKKGAR
ncbi:MAG: aminotransferase class I/II-fold pyridoxal phosphate-dependent enzyme, partial [Anoxybacillus ayderensis]|nr:aminotransferase class I/II-fold pyridoxal phosphate-dependent enzyme [Anoxybacillus ayderensis]